MYLKMFSRLTSVSFQNSRALKKRLMIDAEKLSGT